MHKLIRPADGVSMLYQQNHFGVYRSADEGDTWQEISAGLPSDFGFPMAVHPRDSRTVYVIPLDGNGRFMPEGKPAIWRSRDAGDNWERLDGGLPPERAYMGVLREGVAVDALDPVGVYFGTNTGQLFASRDEGQTWTRIAEYLPPILSVEVGLACRLSQTPSPASTSSAGARRRLGEAVMGTRVVLLIGTKKGAFFAESDAARREWRLRGPLISGTWTVYDLAFQAAAGESRASAPGGSTAPRAATGTAPRCGGATTWGRPGPTPARASPTATRGPAVEDIWRVTPAGETLYAGVDPAGLFASADGGQTWRHLEALRAHEAADGWRPTRAGLPLHAILLHPQDPRRMWAGIGRGGCTPRRTAESRGSVCRTPGGRACTPWPSALRLRPRGRDPAAPVSTRPMEQARLYQQGHEGVFRSEDGGARGRTPPAGSPPASASPWSPTPATLTPCTSCPSTPVGSGGPARGAPGGMAQPGRGPLVGRARSGAPGGPGARGRLAGGPGHGWPGAGGGLLRDQHRAALRQRR